MQTSVRILNGDRLPEGRREAYVQSEGLRGDLYAIKNSGPSVLRSIDVSMVGLPESHAWLASNDKEWPAGEGKDIITKQMLKRIENEVLIFDDKRGYNNLIYYAAFLALFTTQGRCDRITREGGLRVGALEFEGGGCIPKRKDSYVFMRILGSKTNQNKRTHLPFCLCYCNDPCFLCVIKEVYRRRKESWIESEPIFVLENGTILDYKLLLKCLKFCMKQLGFDESKFGLHSLRSGGNAENWAKGFSTTMREHLSNWASSSTRKMYEKKIKQNKEQMIAIAKNELSHRKKTDRILQLCEENCDLKLSPKTFKKRLKKKRRKHRKRKE
eukprot:620024_1